VIEVAFNEDPDALFLLTKVTSTVLFSIMRAHISMPKHRTAVPATVTGSAYFDREPVSIGSFRIDPIQIATQLRK
jgi:hypothetical protein